MTRAKDMADGEYNVFAADEISGDKVSGGTIGAGTFNGTIGSSASFPAGIILQVQYGVYSNEHYTESTHFDDAATTAFQVSITPADTSNKIIVYTSWEMELQTADEGGCADFYRDIGGTSVDFLAAATSQGQGCGQYQSNRNGDRSLIAYSFLDSPNTTSQIIYRPSLRISSGSGRVYIGTGATGTNFIMAQELKV